MDHQGVAKPNTENSTMIAKNVMHILMFSFLIEYQCSDQFEKLNKDFCSNAIYFNASTQSKSQWNKD